MNNLCEILFEIAMSIGTSLDLNKTIHEALTVYIKRMNCIAGAVFLKKPVGFSDYAFTLADSIPKRWNESRMFEEIYGDVPYTFTVSDYQEYMLSLPRNGKTQSGFFYMILCLPGEGIIVLARKENPFSDDLIMNLNRINQKFAYAISSSKKENAITSSQYKYRELILSLPQAFFETDLEGKIIFLNRSGKKILGIDSFISDNSLNIKMFIPYHVWDNLTGKKINPELENFYPNGTEVSLKKLDNTKIPVLLYVNPVFEENKHTAFRFIVIDITERKQAENIISNMNEILEKQVNQRTSELNDTIKTLKQTQNQLVHSEKMVSIGQLAAGVAHEINNPTGFVMNNLSVLKEYIDVLIEFFSHIPELQEILEQGDDEQLRAQIKKSTSIYEKNNLSFILEDISSLCNESINGTERIRDIVLNLRNFARQDEGVLRPGDINKGIEEAINLVWNKLKYKCTLEKDFSDLPEIKCNINQLEQVFVNLLVNAADAIEESGTIRIKTYTQNNQIIAEFKDSGSGIPEENIKSLFDPFFTTKEVGKGTGLGLSISHGIVETHKGNIEVESELGKGSLFRVILPVA